MTQVKQMNEKKFVKDLGNGVYEIKSFSDPSQVYTVDTQNVTCSCPAFTHRQTPCKHIDYVLSALKKPQVLSKQIYTFYSVTGQQFEIHSPNYLTTTDMQLLVGGAFQFFAMEKGEVLCINEQPSEDMIKNPFFPRFKGNILRGTIRDEYFSGWK